MTFHAIYEGEHGKSVNVDNPRLVAYQAAAWAQAAGYAPYVMTEHTDGAITLEVPGLLTLTYEN